MKKKLYSLPLAAVLLCTAFTAVSCGDGGEPKASETFAGVASAAAYETRESALQAFLKEETDFADTPLYVRYEKKGELSADEIAALNLSAEERNGLVGGEKVVITYRRGTTSRASETENTYTQSAYLLNYGSTYRYYAALPEVGEPLTYSYFQSVVGEEYYTNYTFTAHAAQTNWLDSVRETHFSENVDAKAADGTIYVKSDIEEAYYSYDQMKLYLSHYGNALGNKTDEELEEILRSETELKAAFLDEEYRIIGSDNVYCVKKSATSGDYRHEDVFDWYAGERHGTWTGGYEEEVAQAKIIFWTRYEIGNFLSISLLPYRMANLGCGAYVKTEKGFALSDDVIREVHTDERKLEARKFDFTVVNGKIGRIEIDCDLIATIDGNGKPLTDASGNPINSKATYTLDCKFTETGKTQIVMETEPKQKYDEFLAGNGSN